MTKLTNEAIEEFMILWKDHYNEELPREEAVHRAHQLFSLIRMLCKPSPAHEAKEKVLAGSETERQLKAMQMTVSCEDDSNPNRSR